jgi:hypothetical protein
MRRLAILIPLLVLLAACEVTPTPLPTIRRVSISGVL